METRELSSPLNLPPLRGTLTAERDSWISPGDRLTKLRPTLTRGDFVVVSIVSPSGVNPQISDQSGSLARRANAYMRVASNVSQKTHLLRRIELLSETDATWAGQAVERPNRLAIKRAKSICQQLADTGLAPDHAIASGDGGVALCFVRGDAYADIEILNSGELIACIEDKQDTSKVWSFNLGGVLSTISQIRQFLKKHGNSRI